MNEPAPQEALAEVEIRLQREVADVRKILKADLPAHVRRCARAVFERCPRSDELSDAALRSFKEASDALADRMDTVAKGLEHFYFGRFDIRYEKDEDLRDGKNFKVLEVNGFASEATSIYDPRNSVFAAYRTLFRQWEIVFRIGVQNRRANHPAPGLRELWRRGRRYQRQRATHPAAD